ncbi:cytochrome c oxidase assembly factor 3 homolog, mitochondrial [Pyxicephalus adspersus]|uniref:Cytochrome c oxidase assembly factor 3 n=1 Tax=Pyxicephalus adspersus TaxID=30357 RepID=A0AAV3ALM1_PYXAD|nr:TPA: hypothetical protein GDO54_008420 [Pyxicephalus adspersus]
MAEQGREAGAEVKFAQKADLKKLSPEHLEFIRKKEMALLVKSGKLRTRNTITGLVIGGIVLGIYGYTFFSVSQERFLDELEDEAKVARASYPRTSAN